MYALGGGVPAVPRHPVDLLDERRIDPSVDDCFHHSQMLEIIVRLEEGIAGEELDQYTPDTPNVARVRPPKSEDDFGRPIVAGRHD